MGQRSSGAVVGHSTTDPEIMGLNQATTHKRDKTAGKKSYKMDQRRSGAVVKQSTTDPEIMGLNQATTHKRDKLQEKSLIKWTEEAMSKW